MKTKKAKVNQTGMTNLSDMMRQIMAFGGGVKSPVEVEGKEVAETPKGDLIDFKGPSHEQGGIDVELPEGTEIFSKRIKIKGKTMAERKKAREKKLSDLEKLLEKSPGDITLKKSIKRTKKTNEEEEASDQALQDKVKAMKASLVNKGEPQEGEESFAWGGSVKLGDAMAMAGTLYGSLANRKNTKEARAGETPNINAFEEYGQDSLDTIESSKDYIAGQRDNALRSVESSRRGSIARNRNSARGVNTMRALDIGTEVAASNAESNIYDNFAKEMMQILSNKAKTQSNIDQVVMSGEAARDDADRRDRGAYYSNKAIDNTTLAEGVQNVGKMMNQMQFNTDATNTVNDAFRNFKYSGGVLTDKNGVPVSESKRNALLEKAKSKGFRTIKEYLNS